MAAAIKQLWIAAYYSGFGGSFFLSFLGGAVAFQHGVLKPDC
jgi:hypothetical protein